MTAHRRTHGTSVADRQEPVARPTEDVVHARGAAPVARPRRVALAAFAGLNALAAWAGAVGLAVGAIDFGPVIDERLPFESLGLAALALAAVVAIPLTILAWCASTGSSWTDAAALVAGVLLLVWIVGQVLVIRAFSPFQPAYLLVGAGLIVVSHRVRVTAGRRGGALVLAGAVVAAVGVGLVPHLVDHGLSGAGIVSLLLLSAGLGAVVAGAVSALRGRGPLRSLLGGTGAVVAVVAAVTMVAPGVAATRVPSSAVGATPDAVGLAFETVRLRTTDGVDLAGWYLAGTNRAGVVVLHGAGSTRSDVLEQAAVLVRAGYSALLLDARGHGDSGGRAMDFGWYGDEDVVAATTYLASRAEVDRARIGVVGFSMGGEEAIGAAAAEPSIRAVVAEGATARRAADKAWLSDVYGWRGWVQEQIEKVQDGVTGYLAEASPPTALRAAVMSATGTRFLLVTAGTVRDEAHAAASIRSGAPDRVVVWEVPGAPHTAGHRTQPDEWRERVLAFLDDALR